MTNTAPDFYCQVSVEPSDPEAFQNIPIQRHKTSMINFNIKLCVLFEKSCSCGETHLLPIPSMPTSSHYMSCREFFRCASSFLRSNLSHDLITPELLGSLVPDIISCAQEFFYGHPQYPYFDEDIFMVYPLAIEVILELPEYIEVVHMSDEILFVSEQSMQEEINMVPASTEAIESLKKINLSENIDVNGDVKEKNQCCICLEDLEQVSIMTHCRHIFHNNCIISWLKVSYKCPLCRYPMAKAHQD